MSLTIWHNFKAVFLAFRPFLNCSLVHFRLFVGNWSNSSSRSVTFWQYFNPFNLFSTGIFLFFDHFGGLAGSMSIWCPDPRSKLKGQVGSGVRGQGQRSKVKVKVKGHSPAVFLLSWSQNCSCDQKFSPGFGMNLGRQAQVHSNMAQTRRQIGRENCYAFCYFLILYPMHLSPAL